MARFGYGRVSTLDQTAENQRLELEQAGGSIDYWFSDCVSGAVPAAKRPQFAEMLGKLRDGETLVVSKLDRLGRNTTDILGTLQTLAARKIRVAVLQLGGIDLTSTAGKVMVAVLAAVAEMERDLIVERTKAGLVRAKAQGKRLGRPPRVTPEQRERMRERYFAGESPTVIARDFGVSKALVFLVRDERSVPGIGGTTRGARKTVSGEHETDAQERQSRGR